MAFFMAWLLLNRDISRATTVLNYETHTKFMFRGEGCHPEEYETSFLGQLRRGIENVLPAQADKRKAFLLPHHLSRVEFADDPHQSVDSKIIKLATVLGFIGMLRPHTFLQLKFTALVPVCRTPPSHAQMGPTMNLADFLINRGRTPLLGFFLEFKSKTLPTARAYFPNLSTPKSTYAKMCPVKALADVVFCNEKKGDTPIKLPKVRKFLQKLTGAKKPVPLYALRIGGRTWNLNHGLDRQFVDYLGTWKSSQASSRYYRAEPAAVLRRLRRFYDGLPAPHLL